MPPIMTRIRFPRTNLLQHVHSLPPRWRAACLVTLPLLLGLVCIGGWRADGWLTSTEFCSSACHEMESHASRFAGQRHSVSIVGGCAGCHVRPGVVGHIATKIAAAPQLAGHVLGGVDPATLKLNAGRRTLTNQLCADCHGRRYTIDLRHVPLGTSIGVTDAEGTITAVTCIDCHPAAGHYDGRFDAYAAVNPAHKAPENASTDRDCLACHTCATPEIVTGWMASKEAATAQGCSTCHGLDHRKMNQQSTGAKCPLRPRKQGD